MDYIIINSESQNHTPFITDWTTSLSITSKIFCLTYTVILPKL